MKLEDFDYNLPPELIAQYPAEERDASRLLVIHRDTGVTEDKHFFDVLQYLEPGDLLVMNNSKVIPARLYGVKAETGAKVELLLTKRLEGDVWESMVRPGRRLKPGDRITLSETPRLEAEIVDYSEGGTRKVRFHYEGVFLEILDEIGRMPLPPYIDRESEDSDKDRYQTVYAKEEGSVAAPTAGLHFTKELLENVREKGVGTAEVTLHVGIGTFRPVKVENIEEHHMHFEEYAITAETAKRINDTHAAGKRVIAVGTTSTRTLESAAVAADSPQGKAILAEHPEWSGLPWLIPETSGGTDIFIYPGYEYKAIDGLITNFHLPKSTLMMLISAFYDREKVLEIYRQAVEKKYRFFSYGDACLFL